MQTFHIPSMTCGGCARRVTGAVQALDAGAQVDVDLASRTVRIASAAGAAALAEALGEAGYPPVRSA